MEKVVFSKPKLGLAVFTAPRQAFEEILNQRLLGSALVITACAGLLAFIGKALGYFKDVNSVYDMGTNNPITSVAWLFAVALIIQFVAKMNGGQGKLSDTVISLGWAHLVPALAFVLFIFLPFAPRLAGPASVLRYALFLVICVMAMEHTHKLTLWKAALVTVFAFFADFLFRNASYTIAVAANPDINRVTSLAGARPIGDPVYLLIIAVLAGVSVFSLLKQDEERKGSRVKLALGMFAIAGVVAALVVVMTISLNPIGHLKAAKAAYTTGDYGKAVSEYGKVLEVFPGDTQAEFFRAHSYLGGGDYRNAKRQFNEMLKRSGGGSGAAMETTRALTGLGAVDYARGNYDKAVSSFDKALKQWPNYREAHTRKSLALLRMNKVDEAAKSADKALKDGADSGVPFVVLAQTEALKGNDKKALENIDVARKRFLTAGFNVKAIKSIGDSPDQLRTAVEKLPEEFLKYPVETEPAQIAAPKQKKAPAKL